jgi:hypothetical protein
MNVIEVSEDSVDYEPSLRLLRQDVIMYVYNMGL